MKKIGSLLLGIAILFACVVSFSACFFEYEEEKKPACTHSYELVESHTSCESNGLVVYVCTLCNERDPRIEPPLGHDWKNNRCENCKKLKLNPMDNNVLTIDKISWRINFVDGVEPTIIFTNKTNKQIAYVSIWLEFFDRMGNPGLCEVQSKYSFKLDITGPINAGEQHSKYFDIVLFNNTIAAVKPTEIKVEFTDGTTETILCTGEFWTSSSYYGGPLHD